jgi:signal transduction histidine kinase
MDRNMRHIYVNPAMESVLGKAAAECLGKTGSELGLPPELVQAWNDAIRKAFESGQEQRFGFQLGKDGSARYFSARAIPEHDAEDGAKQDKKQAARKGKPESVLGIAYDVSERKQMEQEHTLLLERERAARIQAESAARARDEFLAIVSHELRAPLNGIQSWTHILENHVPEGTTGSLARRALNGIKTGVAQQVRLIEDLLDATRMLSGRLRLVKQPFALLPVIQAAVESVRGMASAKRIAIHCNTQLVEEQIHGDPDRIQQILWNLLSNAIKFTPQDGNVWITADGSEGQAQISVRDDGIGIAPEFLPHLFDRFSQHDTSTTRGHSGLGLGLFLVRYLIELHGGSVRVESPGPGKGASFSALLPLRTSREKYVAYPDAASRASLPSLTGLRILLIDDQEEARESLGEVLGAAGANVFPAASVMEVLEWLPGAAPEDMPDILVCDIAMPVEDGYSVLRKLRAWDNGKGKVPLQRLPALALTAFAQREDRIRALTAGFQMHLPKPVSPEELIIVIAMIAMRK